MAVNSSRSQRRSLLEGTTDGKYRKVRPDTEVAAGTGHENTHLNRAHLLPGQVEADHGYAADQLPLDQMEYPGA